MCRKKGALRLTSSGTGIVEVGSTERVTGCDAD